MSSTSVSLSLPVLSRICLILMSVLQLFYFTISATAQSCTDFNPQIEFIDPNNSYHRIGTQITNDPIKLSRNGPGQIPTVPVVDGFAADGDTPVLIRLKVACPGTVQIAATNGTTSVQAGTLFDPITGVSSQLPITVDVHQVESEYWAFALVYSPPDFVRVGTIHEASDITLGSRPVIVNVNFSPTAGGGNQIEARSLKLVRPPVVMLHGINSNGATWKWPLLNPKNNNAPGSRFFVSAVSYPSLASFRSNAKVPQEAIRDILWKMRRGTNFVGTAVTQADVVTHSMGSVLTRLFVAEHFQPEQTGTFLRDDNFRKGDIHRFIPITAPFHGSPVPDIVLDAADSLSPVGRLFSLIFKYDPDFSALGNLRSGLVPSPTAAVRTHSIIGTGGSGILSSLVGNQVFQFLESIFDFSSDSVTVQAIQFASDVPWLQTFNLLFGGPHDFVVKQGSQLSCMNPINTSTAIYDSAENKVGIHTSVTSELQTQTFVLNALNASIDNPMFATGFEGNCNPGLVASPPSPRWRSNGTGQSTATAGIRIISPAPNTHVMAGSLLTVTVEQYGSFNAESVLIASPYRAREVTTGGGVFTASFDIPVEALGPINLAALGKESVTHNIIVSEAVPIIVDSPATLVSMRALDNDVLLFNSSSTHQARIIGLFTDNVERDVTDSAFGTRYTIVNPNIAAVTANGKVTSKAIGQTTLRVIQGPIAIPDVETTVAINVLSMRGDADNNGVWDLNDFIAFENCFSGSLASGGFVVPSTQCREMFDFDGDGDVDLDDFNAFLTYYSGPLSDCDGNGNQDLLDILSNLELDNDRNGVLDLCECTVTGPGGSCGSCCALDSGTCSETPEAICTLNNFGVYIGAISCPTEVGACHTSDGNCREISEACCNSLEGSFEADAVCEQECSVTAGSLSLAQSRANFGAMTQRLESLTEKLASGGGTATLVGGGGSIQVVLQGGVLRVLGTDNDDVISINAAPGAMFEVHANSTQYAFNLSQINSVVIQAYAGNDSIIFDDQNGQISNIFPSTDIDLGEGNDTLIGATGTLSVASVLAQMNTLLQAQTLLTQAEQIISQAGAVTPIGGNSTNLISNSMNLVNSAYQSLILPATDFIGDAATNLILPATEVVEEAHNLVIAQSLQLIADSYNNLAMDAIALRNSAETELYHPALGYEALSASLYDSATQLKNLCFSSLMGNGANSFITELDNLVQQAIDLAESCQPEADEPPEFFPSCSGIELRVDCAEERINEFELEGELCIGEGDELADEADDFNDNAQASIGDMADIYEERGDALVDLADALVLQADALSDLAEDFRVRAEADLEAVADTFETRGESELHNAGTSLDVSAQLSIDQLNNSLIALTEQLVVLLTQRLNQANDILTGGIVALSAGSTQCDQIAPTNTINGGPGANLILGTIGDDTINGFGGTDLVIGGPGNDIIFGGSGLDLIFGGSGVNELRGEEGVDILVGAAEKDCIYGDDGIDLIFGLDGEDEIFGGRKTDIILGMSGNDVMSGDDGIDIMLGMEDHDEMQGGGCIDLLIGGPGADTISGDAGQELKRGTLSMELGNLIFGGVGDDIIWGDNSISDRPGIDLIFGGDENDQINGSHGGLFKLNQFEFKFGNILFGGTGNDTITSTDGVDVIFGGSENDTIMAGQGYVLAFNSSDFSLDLGDLVFGQDGNDTIHGDDPLSTKGGSGIDVLFGGADDDIIWGYNGGDLVVDKFALKFGNVIFGNGGNDTLHEKDGIGLLFGGEGFDILSGGNGYELSLNNGEFLLNFGDLLIGGTGDDTLYGDAQTDSDPNVDDGIDVLFGGQDNDNIYSGGGGRIEISSVLINFGNIFFGGQGQDLLQADYQTPTGQDGIDLMFGGGDDDILEGGAGGDVVVTSGPFYVLFGNIMFGGNDNDTIRGGNGFDLIFSGNGDDTAIGLDGIDLMFGGKGSDNLDGGMGGIFVIPISGVPTPIPFGNIIFGGDETDTISSAGSKLEMDLLFGNKCDDIIRAGDGSLDLVFGNAGYDTIFGEAGIDLLFGNQGEDTIDTGLGLFNLAFGNRGADNLQGTSSADILFGNRDDDTINGGSGIVDLIFGGDGVDIIHGDDGFDVIFGNRSGDELYGDSAIDLIFGNSGKDVIKGGTGPDVIFGNSGEDQIDGEGDADLIFGNSENDRLSGEIVFGNSGDDRIVDGGGGVYFGNSDNDVIIGSPSGICLMFGNSGDDAIFSASSSGLDVLFGNSGNDFVRGSNAKALIFGNSGSDCLLGKSQADLIFGGGNNDNISLGGSGSGRGVLFGGQENDQIVSGSNEDAVFGNGGADTVKSGADGTVRDWLFGNRGNDTLFGCQDSDKLWGGFGTDAKHRNDCSSFDFCTVAFSEITGTVWENTTGNGTADVGLVGVTVYIDANGDSQLNSGELSTQTTADDLETVENEAGRYSFTKLPAGSYLVRQVTPPGMNQISQNPTSLSLDGIELVDEVDFINSHECQPTGGGSICSISSCTQSTGACLPTQQSTISTCDNDGSACTTSADCGCAGNCITREVITACGCVSDQTCLAGGDEDNFANSTNPEDAIFMRPDFEAWINRPGGHNALFHNGQSLPFDRPANSIDWDFGYSFVNLQSISSATLKVRLKSSPSLASTDGFALQFNSSTPSFAWGRSMNHLDAHFGGDGYWSPNEELTFTLDLSALPLATGGTYNLIPRINLDGFLDIYLQDDTGIDYLKFCYQLTDGSECCQDKVWNLASQVGPSARQNHTMVYLDSTEQSLLFGGYDGTFLNDTWTWNGTTWSQLIPAVSPPARELYAMSYDSQRNKVVLFGGWSNDFLSDTWEWDGVNWIQIATTIQPQPRSGHQMVYDSARGVTVLFGGVDCNGYFGDTWEWNGNNWTLISNTGPSPRNSQAMTFDSVRNETVLFGGQNTTGQLFDTWTYNGQNWQEHTVTGPSPRTGAEMVFNPDCGYSILFSGLSNEGEVSDVWAWDNHQWRFLPPGPIEPAARTRFAMSYNKVNRTMLVNGGFDGINNLRETWSLQCTNMMLNSTKAACGANTAQVPASNNPKIVVPEKTCRSNEQSTEGLMGLGIIPAPPTVAPSPHNLTKSRYISFNPSSPGSLVPTAIEVVLLPSCRKGWVGTPQLKNNGAGFDRGYVSLVVEEPVFRVWSEDVVHLTGCVVAPESSFELRATADTISFSTPLTLNTGIWGDIAGPPDPFNDSGGSASAYPTNPDGIVNQFDMRVLQLMLNNRPVVPVTRADLAGQWPSYRITNDDKTALQSALSGNPYPPANFPYPDVLGCPLGTGSSGGGAQP